MKGSIMFLFCILNQGSFSYQTKWPKDRHSRHIFQTKLYNAQGYDDTIKYIPAFLEVFIRIHGNNLEEHLSRKDPCENLDIKVYNQYTAVESLYTLLYKDYI